MISACLRTLLPERWRPIGYLTALARERTGGRVRSGPFAGMLCAEKAHFSAYIPKLLGTYERELSGCVEAACERRPKVVVDVGAAEGYYAVGLARRLPEARVIAFEMDPQGREILARTMALNAAQDRVEVRGRCEPADLRAALDGAARALVVCDVEGYEQMLLDPAAVPGLHQADILVELHEFAVRGIGEELTRRFAGSHEVTLVKQEERRREEFPFRTFYTRLLPGSYLDWAVSEWRPEPMTWLWMEARARKDEI